MSTVIKLKRSTTPSAVPTTSDLEDGEIAVNVADQKIYVRNSGSIVEVANVSSGSNTFSNVLLSDSTNIAADSSSDTLNLSSAGLIAITGNASTDTITVSTPTTAAIPFLKADETSSNIELQTSGSISEVLTNLYIPFTKADGSAVETLVVGSS